MEIIRGKQPGAKKIVIYGPEGIGKSTFASRFPEPLFIDTEGSTNDMDVARFPAPSSWQMLLDQIQYIKSHPELCRTLVIDTADWAEMLCAEAVCDKSQKSGIEDFGYGKGYVYLAEEFGRMLNLLSEVVKLGIHTVVTAHAKMRKFEQPDEMGAYDRWELKLQKQTAPLLKEWADMVLFANYKTIVVNVDGQGAQKGRNKAQGGKRVMYTSHHPCWDAKNRYGLPEELPFTYEAIRHIIEAAGDTPALKDIPTREQQESALPVDQSHKKAEETRQNRKEERTEAKQMELDLQPDTSSVLDPRIPKKLRDLMAANQVCEWDIQNVVEARGYFPGDMPIWDYPEDFVEGCLVGAWDKVYGMIQEAKKEGSLVFQ